MQRLRLRVVAAAVVLLAPSGAYSQDAPKTGVTTGFPTTIGLIFHPSDEVAVRPEFSFSRSSNDGGLGDLSNVNNRFSVGVSALFYLRKIDDLRLYVAPRLVYSRSHTTIESGSGLLMQETTATTVQPSGMFGAQYSLHRRFAVYGEAGAAYARLTTKGKSTTSLGFTVPTDQKGHGFSNVGGVGVIVYF